MPLYQAFLAYTIGSHILSGAVLEPTSLDELLPGWSTESTEYPRPPPHQPVLQDKMLLFLNERNHIPLPKPPQMNNKGNFIISLSQFTRWMAKIAEGMGVEIYPGTSASKVRIDGAHVCAVHV